MYSMTGSVVGVLLGLLLDRRMRAARQRLEQVLHYSMRRTEETAQSMQMHGPADVSVPQRSQTRLFNVVSLGMMTLGGMLLGGEAGTLAGAYSARRAIGADPEAQIRIERAMRAFQADLLRRQADALDGGNSSVTANPSGTNESSNGPVSW